MKNPKFNLKFALVVMLALTVCTTSFAQKKVINIKSAVKIDADKKNVYDLIRQLERFPEWSPFLVTDPNQKYEISGTNGEIGSKYSWVGVDEKSKGEQTLAALENDKYVRMECNIVKPFKGKPVFEYQINQSENGTEVVQDFNLHLNGFSYFMTKLFGVRKKMTETNELGLSRLKALVEKEAISAHSKL